MAQKSNKPYMVRLPEELADRFREICSEFRGLPPSTVLRLLIAAQLSKNLDEQIVAVTEQIRRGAGNDEHAGRATASRVSRLNTSKPH